MFALANMPHLFMNELTGLRARRLSGALRLSGTFNGLFFRHNGQKVRKSRAVKVLRCSRVIEEVLRD